MTTSLRYLSDSSEFKSTAQFLEIRDTEKGTALILDQTIFYPQGGGQPADTGKITSPNGVFVVTDVRMDETGAVFHFGSFEEGSFDPKEEVSLEIDADKRKLNTRSHSAGHLIDVAVEKVGITGITPTKGYHFPQGAYVEYEGMLDNPSEWIPKLEEAVNKLVNEDLKVEKTNLSFEEAQSQGIWAPQGKSVTVVNFEGDKGCGCGGTHVMSAKEIGHIKIRKIKSKKGVTRVSYELD